MKAKFPDGDGRLSVRSLRAVWLLARDAGESLLGRPWHAVGMISGILLAVASVTATVTVAETQQAQVDLRFDLQRSSHAIVQAETPGIAGFSRSQVAVVEDLEVVSSVGEFSTWSDQEPVNRSVETRTVSVPILVADAGGLRATGTRLDAGASLSSLDSLSPSAMVWVGSRLAEELSVGPPFHDPSLDSQVIVAGQPFSVAGIVRNDSGFEYVDSAVVMSRSAAVGLLDTQPTNVRFIAHVRPGAASAVAKYSARVIDPAGEMSLVVQTPPDGQELLSSVGNDLRRVGIALGALIGVIGMIAVSNTLMMAVHHRLRELGLRSAMGWSRFRIAVLVLSESGLAGLVAGTLGVSLGLTGAAAWSWTQGWEVVVSPLLPVLALFAGTCASILGGLVPALRAASISPLTAMRS